MSKDGLEMIEGVPGRAPIAGSAPGRIASFLGSGLLGRAMDCIIIGQLFRVRHMAEGEIS